MCEQDRILANERAYDDLGHGRMEARAYDIEGPLSASAGHRSVTGPARVPQPTRLNTATMPGWSVTMWR